jgi:AraC family transcriptional regulator
MLEKTPLTRGNVLRRLCVGGFDVLESEYLPHQTHPFHEHDCPVFVYVLNGRVSVRVNGGDRECPSASLRLVPAGERHQTRYGNAPTRCLVIGIGEERASTVRQRSSFLEEPSYHPPRAPVTAYAARVQREIERNDTLTPLAVEGLLLDLMVAASRSAPFGDERRVPAWLANVRERLHAEFRTSFRLTELAADAGVHPVHLSRTFRRHFGCTIAEYVRGLRLEWAKAALLADEYSVGRIALDAGFADHSDFSRQFRDAIGVTPSHFRAGAGRR